MARTTTLGITGKETRPVINVPIPGPEAQRIVRKDERFVATTTKTAPFAALRGLGAVVQDVDGNVLLDFAAGIGVLNTGHSHPKVLEAVRRQMENLVHFAGTDFYYQAQADLAERLAAIVPGGGDRKTFFANSGTGANEAAIKVAKWTTERPQLLAFQRAFHGRTMGALSLTSSKTVQRERFFPTMPGVTHIPFPDPYRNVFGIDGYADPDRLVSAVLGFIEEIFDSSVPPAEVAAMFVEPIQGEGGYIVPPKNFFRSLKPLLEKHGILMVADEVQSGIGRTGRMFAMEHFGVAPEIVTVAKALASGFPIGAAVYESHLDFGERGAHSNTFGGNLVSCAAAIATLDAMKSEKLPERAERLGAQLGKRLAEMKARFPAIGEVRGIGLMQAVDFVKNPRTKEADAKGRDAVLTTCVKKGLIILPAGKSAIRIIPPLVIGEDQLQGGLDVLEAAIKESLR